MRLFEFDDLDRSTFKARFGMSIEDSLIEITDVYNKISNDYNILSSTSQGKIALESMIGTLMDKIQVLFDFYNKCNDDKETRKYLDAIIDLNNKLASMLDNIR